MERRRRSAAWSTTLVLTLTVPLACSGDDAADTSAATTTGATTTVAPTTGGTDAATTTQAPDVTATPAPPTEPPTEPPSGPPPTSAVDTPAPDASTLTGLSLAFEPYADVDLPTTMAVRDGDPALYVGSQDGFVWRVAGAGDEPELVLDLSDEVSPYETGSERGLLGLAFDPTDGRMFVYFTDGQIDSHVVSFTIGEAGPADTASRRTVLFIDQPGLGHKGGGMAFEPSGVLYIASGDGGASSGRDAQDYSLLLGGILRIDPKADGDGYDVPADNPFVGQDGKAPELWAKGLRNPWGFWRDPVTGNLWTADVGNHTMEEIDRVPAGVGGLNFGWYFIEGTEQMHSGAPDDAVAPVWAYRHDEIGPAAIGGRVYRGTAIPELVGAYVFADMSGPIFAVGAGDETVRLPVRQTGIVTGFGIGPDGELYIMTLGSGLLRLVPG